METPTDTIIAQFCESSSSLSITDAIVYDENKISYEQLQCKVNKLASIILDHSSPGAYVGFCLERGIENIITMLAIWKAGCAYVPLDKKYPLKRIDHIMKDTGLQIVITNIQSNSNNTELLSVLKTSPTIIDLNHIDYSLIQLKQTYPEVKGTDIAYIIYTSGTTGLPKGVMIQHAGLLNLIKSAIKILQIKQKMNFYLYASVGFDAAGWDIYISLLSGGTLHIANENLMISPVDTHTYMLQHNINMATVTPAFLADMPMIQLGSLQILVVMGDKPIEKNMEFWCRGRKCYNGYGPTETTIGATIHEYNVGNSPTNIGMPFDNYNICLLDTNLKLINNVGEAGEIYIGGIGVALGYLNKPELTSAKFVCTQFGRMYKTGDFAKYDEDHNLEFVGRIDNQIKINGVRVELEEIEGYVTELPFIIKASIQYEKEKKRLIVYYMSNSKSDVVEQHLEIKKYLDQKLMRAVVPQCYQKVENFVLTSNGKIDKKQLPIYIQLVGDIHLPTNIIEATILETYKEMFGLVEIGINADYFQLGGDSLGTVIIVTKLRQHGIIVENTDIMRYPVIKDLAAHTKSFDAKLQKLPSKINTTQILTPHQLSIFYYQQLYPTDSSYNTFVGHIIDETLNVNKFIDALQFLINKHESLRTVIKLVNNAPYQEFITLPKLSKSDLIVEMTSSQIDQDILSVVSSSFEMIDSILIRMRLYKNLDNGQYAFVVVKHNIITDAHSEEVMLNDLCNFYNSDNLIIQPECKFTYIKYIDQTNQKFSDGGDLEYWKGNISNFVELSIPKKELLETSQGQSYSMTRIFEFEDFPNFISFTKSSCFRILLSGLYIALARFNQYNLSNIIDITIGSQIANRSFETKDVVGFFISTLFLRNKFNWDTTVCELQEQINNTLNNAILHPHISYDQLVNLAKSKIDVMFVMQSNSEKSLLLDNITTQTINLEMTSNAFPIYIDVYPDKTMSKFKFHVRHSEMYEPYMINLIMDSYEIIMKGIISNYDEKILTIPYLKSSTCLTGQQIKHQCQTITSAIVSVASLCPDQLIMYHSTGSIDYLNESMTYLEILDESNKMAHCLAQLYNVKPTDIIGVKMRRGRNFVITLIAILKVGATYVPIDPVYPNDRINYMLEDCKPTLLIQTSTDKTNLYSGTIVISYEELKASSELFEATEIDLAEPESIAYIIYTSGSTGKPKGCSIKHKSIVNVLYYFRDILNITANDKVWSLTTISFDIMVLEIFLPLTSGCKLLLCPQCVVEDPMNLVEWINKHGPTVLQATPTQFNLIGKHIKPNNNMKILVGGETVTSKLAKDLLNITSEVYNVYGPSETTIWSTTKKVTNYEAITIGKPLYNTKCVVLNEIQQAVPDKCVGELCIGGDGLSTGYYGKFELTSQRFIQYGGEIYYRTGDLVKFTDGSKNDLEIEYVGRTDFQVKINGRRIELGEIVNIMESNLLVTRAVVTAKNHNNSTYLVGYYTGTNDTELLSYMRQKLPPWMVPHFVIHVIKFVETLNGKIDMKALPNPFDENVNNQISFLRSVEYVGPTSEIEKKLHIIYVEIIRNKIPIEKISIKESIINLGCDSLTVIFLISRINKEFNITINPVDYFRVSTITTCAELIESMSIIPQILSP